MIYRLLYLTLAITLCTAAWFPLPVTAFVEDWYIRTGVNGYYSSGIARENLYLKPFAEAGFSFLSFELIPGIYRYQRYQVTDGFGNYKQINYTQAGIEVLFSPAALIDLSAGGRYSRGDDGYISNELFGDFSLNLPAAIILLSGSYRESKYDFDGLSIDTEYYSISGEINLLMDGSGSIDAGLEYTALDYNTFSSAYTTTKGRLGITLYPAKSVIFIASLSYGQDSADYQILGADTSLKLGLGPYLSLFMMYQYAYYLSPVTVQSGSGTHGPGSGTAPGGTNPFLRSSLLGKDYWSQSASFGVTIKI